MNIEEKPKHKKLTFSPSPEVVQHWRLQTLNVTDLIIVALDLVVLLRQPLVQLADPGVLVGVGAALGDLVDLVLKVFESWRE